jgi:carbonic anhydrase/acetyltransferase-like protein (isoleucine patch superfamily)
MAIYALDTHCPELHETAYVTDSATVVGKVILKENASVWFGATLRGDNEPIEIGVGSNVQEGAVLHTWLHRWRWQSYWDSGGRIE